MNDQDTLGPRLELKSIDRPGQTIPMLGRAIQIGRHPDVEIRLDDPRISRHHARIEKHADGTYYLVDTSRHYATYLNGQRLRESRPVQLADGDCIQVGDQEIVFRLGSQVLPVDNEWGTTVLQTIGDLSTDHLSARSQNPEQTLRAVLDVNRSLAGGGDLNEVLSRALSSLMELFPRTEFGVIVTVDPDGQLPIRATRHRGGPSPKLTLSRTILDQVVNRGEAVLVRDVATDARFRENESITRLFRTALCVPLPGNDGRPVGMVQLSAREASRSRFNSSDLDLLAALALPMAVAVENHRLLRERAEWTAAREIQRALLPRVRPEIPGYAFWECYRPALEVGGDLYDYIEVDRDGREPRWIIGVGDVTGKGMPAALLSAAVCPEIRHAARQERSPADVLRRVNRYVYDACLDGRFVTMILADLNPQTHRLTLANAGHELPLIRRASGVVERLELPGSGLPLGVLADTVYAPTIVDLKPGEVVVLHSDGLPDSHDPARQRFGADRVSQTLAGALEGVSLAGEALLDAVMQHVDNRAPFDDLTIVCFGREAT
jgi:phosphoserine phosphatase RsbU/P